MKHVWSGEPWKPSARDHNRTQDAVEFVHRRMMYERTTGQRQGFEQPAIAEIRNNTGTAFDRHDCVYISSHLINPSASANDLILWQNHQIFDAIAPTGRTHLGRVAVLLEPIQNGFVGRGVVSGIVQTKVDILDASHEWCDVDTVSGGRILTSTGSQPATGHILWKESGTGEKWATVRLSNPGGSGPCYGATWGRGFGVSGSWTPTASGQAIPFRDSTAGAVLSCGAGLTADSYSYGQDQFTASQSGIWLVTFSATAYISWESGNTFEAYLLPEIYYAGMVNPTWNNAEYYGFGGRVYFPSKHSFGNQDATTASGTMLVRLDAGDKFKVPLWYSNVASILVYNRQISFVLLGSAQ